MSSTGEHVPGVVSGCLQFGHRPIDGCPYGIARLGEAAVERQRQSLDPVGQHDARADAVHHHGQVLAQPTERLLVKAAREDGLGEHVEREFDHRLAHIEDVARRPGVDGGGRLAALLLSR
ncbi:hypothetical protein [Streptomyces sp. F001]|uniref:hypothetical protein n=1 Tax=Streptomyces sp. F001 TaxID=1510026 RepID=UPI001F0F4D5A|nr:hypothetical protein [Streptomyces sp. F001]